MKKKGLIISTVVMVVVLIASLTTATYAWFTQSYAVTVDSINFQVGAGADMIIGASLTNSFNGIGTDGTTTTAAQYCSGSTEYTLGETFDKAGSWTSTVPSLGSNVSLDGLTLSNITKAVGTGKFTGTTGGKWLENEGKWTWQDGTGLNGTADASFVEANYKTGMIKAEGQAKQVLADTIDQAWKQHDYLDIVMGVQATKSNLQKMTCYVTVNPTQGTVLGMNAAIHVAYAVVKPTTTTNTTPELIDVDVYGTQYNFGTVLGNVTNKTFNDAKTAFELANGTSQGMQCIGGATKQDLNIGAMTVAINLEDLTAGTDVIEMTDIYQIKLVVYIAGFDDDCVEGAKGVASTINITFAGVAKAA